MSPAIRIMILAEPGHLAMNLFLGPRWTKMRNCLAHFAYNGRQLLNLNNLRAGKLAQEPCHFTSKVQIETIAV